MQKILFEKLIVRSTNQEIAHHLWSPKVHCSFHRSTPLVLILNQMNPVHTLSPPVLILFSHLHPNVLCISHLSHTCCISAHPIFLDLITIISGEYCEL